MRRQQSRPWDLQATLTSLAWTIVLPYVRAKAASYHRMLLDVPDSRSDLVRRFNQHFLAYYPYLNGAFEALYLAFKVRFLLNDTPYFYPWLSLHGIQHVRSQEDEVVQAALYQ